MIKEILEQLAPLDAQIAALKGRGNDMEAITAHASELAELAVEEDEILRTCGPLTAEDRVFLARHPERPHIDEIVNALFTDFFEQRGDRQCKEDPAILGGIARFHGLPVTVIGHRKGATLEENPACNFGMTGHLLGGAGGIEAVFTALALHDQFAPPTIHYEQPNPECDLDYVPNTGRAQAMTYALSNSLGFGGHNACIALRRWEG